MATLVLSQIGSAIGGPAASIVGAFAGSAIDRSLLGSSRARRPGLDQLSVQGSGYGGTIPRIYGRMRVAGNIIWSTPIRESRLETAGKAGAGGYGYSVSLAIALSATPITAIGRIWADGKQIRSSNGEFAVPVVMRAYSGCGTQGVDPLIEAAEGSGNAPAYRGLAYLVLEDLQLAEFANRVPQLSFEVTCQNDDMSVHDIVADLASTVGLALDGPSFQTAGAVGYAAGHQGGIEDDLWALNLIEPFLIDDASDRLALRFLDSEQVPPLIMADDLVVEVPGKLGERPESTRTRDRKVAREISVIYAEPARDFEPCLQRSTDGNRVSPVSRERRRAPFAITASLAKRIAERELSDDGRSSDRSEIALPMRYAILSIGDEIRTDDQPYTLTILNNDIENGSINLSCRRKSSFRSREAMGSVGRKLPTDVRQQGPTQLIVADIPQLPSENLDQPRLLIASYGQSADWRQATILMSTDGGVAYTNVGIATSSAITGTAVSTLGTGPSGRWDEINSVTVQLNSVDSRIDTTSTRDVLDGNNVIIVGSELVAFRHADYIDSNKYNLRGLLRGLYGTEHAISSHMQGESFIAMNYNNLIRVVLPIQLKDRSVRFKAVGPSEIIANAAYVNQQVSAQNMKPISPAHLRIRVNDLDELYITWIRRSRLGFSWLDGVDAPLGERFESYVVNIHSHSGELMTTVSRPELAISREQQLQVFGVLPSIITVSVSQISELVGNGTPTTATFQIR